MLHQFSRNELAIGKEGLNILKNSTVAVLGVGGVGSFAVEALARSGVGRIVLVDKDDIDITNVNSSCQLCYQRLVSLKLT